MILPVTRGWSTTAACHRIKLLKTNMIFNWQSNKTQEPFSLFSIPPALFPSIPTEPIWFIWVVVAVLSMWWAKGTLGNFMIHDEASWIILDVCMCHYILIMAPFSWKHRHTFRGDHLIFSLILPLLSTLANTLPLNSSQRSHRLHWHLGFTVIQRKKQKWEMKSSLLDEGNKLQI